MLLINVVCSILDPYDYFDLNILLGSFDSSIGSGVEMLGARVPAGTPHFSRELNIAS